jgi:polyphenol oxidase
MPLSSKPKRSPSAILEAIDTQYKTAGLGRSRRGKPSPVSPAHFEGALQEELTSAVPMPRRATNGVAWLPIPGWDFSWLRAGFSTRVGGVSRAYCADDAPGELNLGFTAADDRELVMQNRRLFAEAVAGDAQTPLVTLRQFHSNLVVHADAADAKRERPRRGDGLIADKPGFLIAIQTADCIPVLVADPRQRVVAAFHAGWRGTVKRIVEEGVGRMRLEFGSRPEDLIAAIGPGNRACSYEVGDEVLMEFESQFTYGRELFREVFDSDPVKKKYPMLFLNQRAPGHGPMGPQLLAAGVSQKAIAVISGCTQCHDKLFFSHRGSRGHAGRMMAVIGIRSRSRKSRPL